MRLKEVINIARGADPKEWPPPPSWIWLFHQIKDAIDDGHLRVVVQRGSPPGEYRFFMVRLADLWEWVEAKGGEWEPIRRLCIEWAASLGVNLSQPGATEEADPPHRTSGPKPPPDRATAIEQCMMEGLAPPASTWKVFSDAVRARAGRKATDRSWGNKTIERHTKKMLDQQGAGPDKTDKSELGDLTSR